MMKKLAFVTSCVSKERELIKLGVNQFVYRQDIEDFIDKVHKKTIKIIELKNYPREIPDDIVALINKTKDIFDEMYVVFTDYNGTVERTVQKERRDKDPIIFGTFQNVNGNGRSSTTDNVINDRFYYIGDWVDEYCDLTLEKMVEVMGNNTIKEIITPENKKELIDEISRINNEFKISNSKSKSQYKTKRNILSWLRTILKMNNG